MDNSDPADVVIVGAGVAGLTCAHELVSRGIGCRVLEAGSEPGGRIASDELDGFTLDRGFQVFLTAYPEAIRLLDYESLRLRRFVPGALVRRDGEFHQLSDPWRRPSRLWSTATARVGSVLDKLRIARFRRRTTQPTLDELYERPEQTTFELLKQHGFSDAIIDQFFRPFLGGVFLDSELQTSSRMAEFVFRMFSLGDAALPAGGMRAIPHQLADKLPAGTLRTDAPIDSLSDGGVTLSTGEHINARAVVIATGQAEAAKLSGEPAPPIGQRVACVYFAASEPPIEDPLLVLNGDSSGPINNLCVPSNVAPEYAPPGQSLVSVTALRWTEPDLLVDEVRAQLADWFGSAVTSWRHLRTYEIEQALPCQVPPALSPVAKSPRLTAGRYLCGDYRDTGSINGAMASGRRAAEAIAQDFGK